MGGNIYFLIYNLVGFPGGASGNEPCQCRRHKRCGFDPWVGKIPWSRAWQSTPVYLPGESHGQKDLMGLQSMGCTIYRTILLSVSQVVLVVKNTSARVGNARDVGSIPGSGRCPGAGHGNPLQCSCLENPLGQKSLEGHGLQGHKESDTTEVTQHTRILSTLKTALAPLLKLS